MMRQFFAAKSKHPNDILFFRMGDFYEMFFDDAKLAAEVLGIALTARSKDKSGDKIPMAGVPVKSLDNHIRRLLMAGHRVAICEQVQDPRDAKGIVDREVVRVVTPGTFLDDENLEDSRPLHLAALVHGEECLGISWVDLSTGNFQLEEVREEQWQETLLRVAPVEILYPEGTPDDTLQLGWLEAQFPKCARTPFPEWHFDYATCRERLLSHFGTQSLEGFGCEHLTTALRAAGGVIHYLRETQRQALPHISRLRPAASGRRLRLDAATHRSLDLTESSRTGDRRGSLLAHLDRTRTAMGARLLREWITTPLIERQEILDRQRSVAALVTERDRARALSDALRQVRDIERLVSRLPLGRVGPRDLKALEGSLRSIPTVKENLAPFEPALLVDLNVTLEEEPLLAIADAIRQRRRRGAATLHQRWWSHSRRLRRRAG